MKQKLKLQAQKIYYAFQDHRNDILLFLATLFTVLLLLQFSYVREHAKSLIDRVFIICKNNTYNLAFVKDSVTSAAIVIAAIWTYYLFVKGRTFKPRISMDITFKEKLDPDIIVFRIVVKNEGRIRIRPLKAPIQFAFLTSSADGGFGKNIPFYSEDNVFVHYFDSCDRFYLEPQDELRIDLPIRLNVHRELFENTNILSNVISVTVVLVDSGIHAWTEKRVIGCP